MSNWILATLATGPASLAELRRAAGDPPQTTMRKHLRTLAEADIVAKESSGGFASTVSYSLRAPGNDLLHVRETLRAWLAAAPEEPIELGTIAAKSAVKALVDGWSSTLIRALAARPLTLTELDSLIAQVSYPSLERRLIAMRAAGQVQAISGPGRGTPYGVTGWLRRAVAPLVSAAYWERRHVGDSTAPIGRIDVEAAFLLALPGLRLSPELSGACQLAVEATSNRGRPAIGVLAGIESGRVTNCRARLEGNATLWLSGTVAGWFRAVREGHPDRLEVRGDHDLADAILAGLQDLLAKPIAA